MILQKVKFLGVFLGFLIFIPCRSFAIVRNKLQRPEIYRYVYLITGLKPSQDVSYYSLTARPLAFYYSNVHWNTKGFPERNIDYIFSDFAGFFDSIQVYDTSSDDALWVSSVEKRTENPFSVEEPADISRVKNEIEEIDALKESETVLEDQKDYKMLSKEELDEESVLDDELLLRSGEGISLEDLPDIQTSEHGTSDEDQMLVNGSLIPKTDLSTAEKRLINSENQLRLHVFEEEIFGLSDLENDKVMVISDGKKMIRKFLDSNLRIYKKETWKTGKNLKDIVLVSTENYNYEDDKAIKPKVKEKKSDKSEQTIIYDEKSRIKEVLNYGYPEKNDSKTSSGKKTDSKTEEKADENKKPFFLLNKTEYVYTENNKIREKKYIEYEYSEEKYGKLIETYEKKDVYDYSKADLPPDYYYYDDGKLCLKTVYSSPRDYVTEIFFENNIRVENYYVNGKHVKDYFYVGNKLKRKKVYE